MNRRFLIFLIGTVLICLAVGLTLAFTLLKKPHSAVMTQSVLSAQSGGPTRTFTNPGGCCNRSSSR
jgi:hypothetical protein